MKAICACLAALSAIFVLNVLNATDSLAFKSGYGFEPIHKNIIKKALESKGFSDSGLQQIINGADSQDDVLSKKFTDSPWHHFDDNLIQESISYFKERFAKAVEYASRSYRHYGSAEQQKSVKDTLFTFGEGLHTIQDFYSHSNYVEMLARSGNQDKLVDWKALPKSIKTGYFYWNGYSDNESTRSRTTCVNKIKEHYSKKGQVLTFHSEGRWQERKDNPTFDKCTAYVLDPLFQCLHYELNKDNASQHAGSVKLPDGRTMHAKARALAIQETDRQWKKFDQALAKKYGKRYQLIFPALMGFDVPVLKLKFSMPSQAAEGKPIPISCNLAIMRSDTEKHMKRKNPYKYDLKVKTTVFKESQMEAQVENELSNWSIGSTGGISFELPPLTGAGKRTVKVKAMFAGDPRYNDVKKSGIITIGKSSLMNSQWLIQSNFGGTLGIRRYTVTVLDDSASSFSVRVLGHKKGDVPAIFKGTRDGANLNLRGSRSYKVKKIVGSNGSIDKLDAGRVVETGEIKHQLIDITATLSDDEATVKGMIVKNKKVFTGKRIK